MAKKPRNKKYNPNKAGRPLVLVDIGAKATASNACAGVRDAILEVIAGERIDMMAVADKLPFGEILQELKPGNTALRSALRTGRAAVRRALKLAPGQQDDTLAPAAVQCIEAIAKVTTSLTTKQLEHALVQSELRKANLDLWRTSLYGVLDVLQHTVCDITFRQAAHFYRMTRDLGHRYNLDELKQAAEAGVTALETMRKLPNKAATPAECYRPMRRMARALDRSFAFIEYRALVMADQGSTLEYRGSIFSELETLADAHEAFDKLVNGATLAAAVGNSKRMRERAITIAQCLNAGFNNAAIPIPYDIKDFRAQQGILLELWRKYLIERPRFLAELERLCVA